MRHFLSVVVRFCTTTKSYNALLIVGAIPIGLLLGAVLSFTLNRDTFVLGTQTEQTPIPFDSTYPTPTPIQNVEAEDITESDTEQPTTQGSSIVIDPVVDCTFQYLGPKRMKQSQCNISFECQINSQWYIYTSRSKCTDDQNAFYRNKGTGTYPTHAPLPTYAPLQTYAPRPTYSYQPYATPTLTDGQAQAIIDEYNAQVQECRNSVSSNYDSLIQSCNQYADSSAYEMCRYAFGKERSKAYDNCGSTY